MPKIMANGIEINYYELGESNPGTPVVLQHGFTAQAKWMLAVAELLVKNYKRHVLAPDLPGHGLSGRREANQALDQTYSIASLARDMTAWIDALKLKKVIFLGHSMGGMVAQLIAKDHPERLEKLILLCTAPHLTINPVEKMLMKVAPLPMLVKTTHARAHPKDYPKDKLAEAVKEALSLTSPVATRAGLVQMQKASFDSTPWLSQISVPTLVIGSENDRSLGFAASKILADNIPGAKLSVIQGGPHEAQVDRPDDVAKAIGSFI